MDVRYLKNAPPSPPAKVLAAEGRTFPVDQMYLEDVYGLTQYRLAPDSPAALRGRVGGREASARLKKQAAASR